MRSGRLLLARPRSCARSPRPRASRTLGREEVDGVGTTHLGGTVTMRDSLAALEPRAGRDMRFFDLGEDIEIELPDPSEVTDLFTLLGRLG